MQAPRQHEPNSDSSYRGPIVNTRGRRIEKNPKKAVDTASFGPRSYRTMHAKFYQFLTAAEPKSIPGPALTAFVTWRASTLVRLILIKVPTAGLGHGARIREESESMAGPLEREEWKRPEFNQKHAVT